MVLQWHTIIQHLSIMMVLIFMTKLSKTKAWNLEVFPPFRCVILGKSASFNCLNNSDEGNTVYPYNIQWFKLLPNGGLQVISISTEERVRSDGHQLRFSSITVEDEGLYCCKALSSSIERGCSLTAMSNLSIALPPVISHLPDQNVSTGDTVLIECTLNYTGNPSVTSISWQLFGRDILANNKYNITQLNSGASLTITNVTEEDEGSYSCITQNSKYQKDNQSMLLLVHEQSTESPENTDNFTSTIAPCNTTESYSVTIGLKIITGKCSILKESVVYNVVNHFISSLCNCDNYCIEVNYITTCSSDNAFIITTAGIKGEQAFTFQNQTYAKLQTTNITVEFESHLYYLFCVTTLCAGDLATTPNNNGTVSSTIENKDVTPVQVLIISFVLILVVGVILLILILVLIGIKKKPSPQVAKNRSHVQISSTEVVYSEDSNGVTGSDMLNSSVHTNSHSYENPDVITVNPGYDMTSIHIRKHFAHSGILHPSSNSNGNFQNCTPSSMKHIQLPVIQKCLDDIDCSNYQSKASHSVQMTDSGSPTGDDVAVHSNKNYDKLQHFHLQPHEMPTDDIEWVTNPSFKDADDASVSYVAASIPCTSQLPYAIRHEACNKNTKFHIDTDTENTLPENNKLSTAWDEDKSSYVTGYSPQFKIPSDVVRSFNMTSSTCRDAENEVPTTPIMMQTSHVVNICEWNSTDV